MLLATAAEVTLAAYPSDYLGRLIQPRHYWAMHETVAAGRPWAADNDCFQGLDELAFVAMLDRIEGLPGCLFVAAPDVVGDAVTTLELFAEWAPRIRERDLPVALVAQDGLELETTPWAELDALFVGGSTDWKLGPAARELILEAKRRDVFVHMGRVNGYVRLRLALGLGVDSIDGTTWVRWRNIYLPQVLRWLAAGEQLALELGP